MKKLAIILLLPIVSFAYTPQGRVSDFASILTTEQKSVLETKLTDDFAVVIVPSLEGDYIEHYAVKLFEEWGIGKKDKDNGLLLLISIADRKLRVEVGYGLEPYITDSQADSVIRNIITPEFKKGDYYTGISKGIDALTALTNGSYVEEKPKLKINFELIVFILFVLFSILGSTKSWWLGGVIGGIAGIIAAFFISSILVGIFVTIGLILLGLLIDYIASKNGGRGPGGMFWGGRGGSGGGGFGGFGGGSSGGGGASGSW